MMKRKNGYCFCVLTNLFILFITIGLWHGANWTYVLWGVSQAILFIPTVLIKRKNKIIDIVAEGKYLPSLKDFFLMIKTFLLTILTMVIFRAKNIIQIIIKRHRSLVCF